MKHVVTLIPGNGIGPDIKGQSKANPTAMILAAIMMLKHMGEAGAAERIYSALVNVFTKRKVFTRDLGGTATTTEFAAAVVGEVKR